MVLVLDSLAPPIKNIIVNMYIAGTTEYGTIWLQPYRIVSFIYLFVCLFVSPVWQISLGSLIVSSINYSRTSFIRTPGDYPNPFVLSKISIN